MSIDWRTICRDLGLRIDGEQLIVGFENGRNHRVRVRETDETIELHAVVARAGAVRDVIDLPMRIWRHNRAAQLVSFRLDSRGNVHASGWISKVGLTAEELRILVHRVAAEADRMEYLLTGRDVE